MILYVVRHGETEESLSKIMQGDMETVLNGIGKEHCLEVKEELKDIHFAAVISSPRKRTVETAKLINDSAPFFMDERLTSRHHGEFQGLSRLNINLKEYWNIKLNKQYDKAECIIDLYNRVDSLIKELKSKYYNDTVLIVTHSGICRLLHYYFNGFPQDGDLTQYESYNCSIERYEVK